MRAWHGHGAALGVSGIADGQDTVACGAGSIGQCRPNCQRDPGAGVTIPAQETHYVGQNSPVPTPQRPARSSTPSRRLTKGSSPLLSCPDPAEGLWRSRTQTCRLSRTQPASRGARQGQGGSERRREGEREAEGRPRVTGRRWTPPAAGKGLALPPAAERRALTGRYRWPTRRPGLAIVARRKRRRSLGAPEPRESSGSAGPPSTAGGAGRERPEAEVGAVGV